MPSLEQRVASGYNRLLQTTEEGGAQPKEYRAIYLADRVRNASHGLAGRHHRLRPVPRPQVRPLPGPRLLQLRRLLRGREGEAGGPPGSGLPARATASGRRSRPLEAEIDRLRKELERDDAGARGRAAAAGRRRSPAAARTSWTRSEPVEASSAHGTRVLIQGNDFSLIATTAARPAASPRHLHRALQDRAQGHHRLPPRGADLRRAAAAAGPAAIPRAASWSPRS